GRILDETSLMTLRAALTLFDPFARGPFKVQTTERAVFDAIVHRSEGLVLLELEPTTGISQSIVELPQFLTRAMTELRAAQSIGSVAQVAATRLRELSGYDRCMVYRFDSRQNGEV